MSKKYIDIEVFDGDDDIKYVRHKDMLNLLEQIRIKQEEKDKEIERLNNIINKIRNWLEEDYKRTINNEVCDYPRYYLDKFDEIVGSDKE